MDPVTYILSYAETKNSAFKGLQMVNQDREPRLLTTKATVSPAMPHMNADLTTCLDNLLHIGKSF